MNNLGYYIMQNFVVCGGYLVLLGWQSLMFYYGLSMCLLWGREVTYRFSMENVRLEG